MDYSLPGPSVHGILQARILEWVVIPFPRDPSWPRDQTQVSCIAGDFLHCRWSPGLQANSLPSEAMRDGQFSKKLSAPWPALFTAEHLVLLYIFIHILHCIHFPHISSALKAIQQGAKRGWKLFLLLFLTLDMMTVFTAIFLKCNSPNVIQVLFQWSVKKFYSKTFEFSIKKSECILRTPIGC